MPRIKIVGSCKVEDCEKEIDSRGLCRLHYHRLYYYGRLHKVKGVGKDSHPLIKVWRERHGYGSLCPEWHNNFWQFVEDVGEKPSKNHYLVKKDRSKPYSKDNFYWLEHIRRNPEESEKEWIARKWERRVQLSPDINRRRGVFFKLGMSSAEYAEKLDILTKTQKGLCAICHKEETRKHKNGKISRLAVDHCHKSNLIRELLCTRCNTTLGRMEESIPLLESMISYIKKYQEN